MSSQIESLGGKNRIDEILLACRLCGAGGGGEDGYKVPIIQKDSDLNNQDVKLCQKIIECVLIEVTMDDKMPQLICELCIDKINDFYLFRYLCKETDNQTRMKLGLPPQNFSQSPVLESALSVTLQLCDHDSSDSEVISLRSTLKRTKRRLRAKSKQVEKQIPDVKSSRHSSQPPLAKDKEPARKDSRPLQNQSNGTVENRYLTRRARKKLNPITTKSMSEAKEKKTSSKINEIDVPLELPQTNNELSLLKPTIEKQTGVNIPEIEKSSDTESGSEMATNSIATLSEDRIHKEMAKINNCKKKFSCDFCGHCTKSKWNLIKHISVHTGERRYKCNLCKHRFTSNSDLKLHKRTHEEKPYKCNVCEYRCTKSRDLITHKRTHTGEKPYKCNVCEYRCKQFLHLIIHKRSHTGEKPYKCNVCEFRCNQLNNLKIHKRTHTGEKPYTCNVCEYKCSQLTNLKTHKRTHTGEKPYKCDVCEYRCNVSTRLKNHKRTHTGEKLYTCNVCEYKCSQLTNLKTHKRTHTGEKPYKCDVCEYRCNVSTRLKNHKRTHTGEKLYTCNVCEYKCNRLTNLKTHKLTHTGEKLYKCDVCEYRCNLLTNLKTHKLTHTGEKPYKCDVCVFRCNELTRLKTHKRTHTGEKHM